MATDKKKTYSDITKEGYQNYKDLQRQNNNNVVIDEEENKKAVEEFYKYLSRIEAAREAYTNVAPRKVASPLLSSGQGYLGESKLDKDRTYLPSEFENINEQRAQDQSAAEKILHGTIKGGVLAGTTFLDGTIGLAYGLGKAVQTGKFSQVWDNDVSRFFNNLNEKSEELLPNYYTEDEQINPWSHVFSANFIGDKFIKNLGFTIGALYSGGVYSAGGKALLKGAIGLGKTLKAQKAISTVGNAVNTATGIVTAAFNEGRVEALNNSKEWAKDKIDNANQEHNNALEAIKEAYEGTEVYNDLIAAENKRYNEVMQKIELDRAKMGNMDLLFNMPILIASNAIQFSKLFGNGFKASRLSNNLGIKGSIKSGYTTSRTAVKDAAKIVGKRFGAEGSEEFGQSIASNIAGDYYGTDVDNYMKQRYAPEAEQETLSFIKSVSRGIAETFGDEHAWEEFFIGGLTGLLGAPTFRSAKTKNGKWQSPIKLNENVVSELWKAGKERAEAKELVDKLNSTRLNMQDYLKGIIQHNATQAYMDKMAKEGNQREYKNAEFDQMSGHIETFARAGKLEDLKTAIEESAGTTDEDLDALIRNTTVKNEDGTLSGPFSDLAEVDDQGNVVSNLDNEKSKQKLVDQITKNKTRLTNMIDTYKDTMDLYKRLYGDKLSNDQVHELTWMSTKIDNFLDRIESMHSNELRDALRGIKGYYNSALSEIEQELTIEGSKGKGDISEKYKKLEELKEKAERNIFSLDTILLAEGDKKQLFNTISANMKNIDAFIDLINAGTTDEYLSEEEKTKALQALEDIKVLAEDKEKFEKKKNEYIKDPDKMDQDNAKTVDEQAEKDKKNKVANHKEAAKNAQDYIAFRDVLDSVQDKEEKDTLIKELEEEKNPHIGTYKEINGYIQAVQAQLDRQPIQEDAKQDVMRILEKRFKAATSLEEAASLDFDTSEHLAYFVEKFGVDKAGEIYLNADYLAKHLLYDANVSEAYKAQFGDKFKVKPESPNNNNNQGNNKQQKDTNVTGADNVSTVPAINADDNSGADSKGSTSKTESLIVSTPYDDIEKNDSGNDNNSNDNLNNNEYQLGDSDDEVPPNGFNDKELSIEGENKGVNDTANNEEEQHRNTKPSNIDPLKTEIIPAIPELAAGESTKIFIEDKPNYSDIYNYLVQYGAFEYVNQGNIKLNDEVGFIIKADFESNIADKHKEIFKKPTIFITHKGKIIGSLYADEDSIKKYLGLEKLIDDIHNAYDKSEEKNKGLDFVPEQKLIISNLYVGKVNFNKEHKERNLGEVIGKDNTGNAVLAIVKDNNLFTNGSGIEVRELKSSVGKTGRIYLMLPTGAGIHIPVAVRVKRFGNGSTDFNINNATDAETDLGKLIIKAIKGLIKVSSKDELKLAIAELNKYLYKGKGIHIDFTDSNGKRQLVIKKAKLDNDGNEIYVEKDGNRERDEEVTFITLSETHDNQEYANDNAYNELVEILQKFNMPIQVSSKHINKGNYNKVLLDSGALTSNLNDTKVRGNWFGIRFKTTDDLKKPSNPINSTDSVVAGEKITIDNETYFVDLSSGEVRDDLGIIMVLDKVQAASILTIAKNYKEGKTEGVVPIYNLDDYTVDLKTGKIEKTDNVRNTDNNINDDDFDAASNNNDNDDDDDTLFREAKREEEYTQEMKDILAKAPRNSEGRLLAPNGKVSNLNKRQYAQVRTKAFKKWFGDWEIANKENPYNKDISIGSPEEDFSNVDDDGIGVLIPIFLNGEYIGETGLDNALYHKDKSISIKDKYMEMPSVGGSNITIEKEYRGKGYGKAAYFELAKFAFNNGKILRSAPDNSRTPSSTRVWESLVRDGYAKKVNNRYEIINSTLSNASKVIDENGEPLVVYHGNRTDNKITTFDLSKKGTEHKERAISGFWFTTDKDIAKEEYALKPESRGKGIEYLQYGEVIPVFLNIKNPVETEQQGITVNDTPYGTFTTAKEKLNDFINRSKNFARENTDGYILTLVDSDNRADDFVSKQIQLVVFNPNQIKSATDNIGTFDENNEDIRYREGEESNTIPPIAPTRKFREAEIEATFPVFDKSKELEWFRRVLPQLSNSDRLKFVDGLIKIANKDAYAWGQFTKGIITLSDLAAEGTLYHEAFHAVFHLLLDEKERKALTIEAIKRGNIKTEGRKDKDINIDAEEFLANEFMDFVANGGKDDRSLGRKILDFFKSLFVKVTHWNKFVPSSRYYFNAINNGKYANKELNDSLESREREEEYTKEMQDILDKAPRDKDGNLLAPNGKKSNLNKRQYAQVRTKAFKEWFGDWEKVAPSTESANRLIDYLNGIVNRNNRFSKLAKLLLDNGSLPYNLKYFKIDNTRDDVKRYRGMWHSLVNLIEVLGNNVSQETIDKVILHELIHYNTEQLLQDYKDNKKMLTTQKEAIRRLYNIIEYSKNYLLKELQTNRDKYIEIAKRQSNTVNSRLFYAFDNTGNVEIDEFISEIFTNPGLQEVLNNIPYKESKQSLWDKIKDAISSIFGFNINKGSVLEEALKESSKLIQNNSDVSKVVDENGEPLVVYHTRDSFKGKDFNIFDTTIEGRETAIYTTNNKEMSSSYWKFGNNRKALADLYTLSLVGDINKVDIDPFTGESFKNSESYHYTQLIKLLNELGIEIDNTKNTYTQNEIKSLYNNLKEQAELEDLKSLFVNIKNPLIIEGNDAYWNEIVFGKEILSTRKIEDRFRNSEYDGIIFKNIKDWGGYNIGDVSTGNVYASYNPNQVKSATDNIGTFNENNDDIRYREVQDNNTVPPIAPTRKDLQEILDSNVNNGYLFSNTSKGRIAKANKLEEIKKKWILRSVRFETRRNKYSKKIEVTEIEYITDLTKYDWRNLTKDQRETLKRKGITEEMWGGLEYDVKKHIIDCIGF